MHSARYLFLFLFASLTALICEASTADTQNSDNSSIIDLKGHPSSVVGGMVNVISGNLIENDVDYIGNGPNPLCLRRSFSGSTKEKGTICYGWNLDFLHKLTIYDGETEAIVLVEDRGSSFAFRGGNLGKHVKCTVGKEVLRWGVTNGGQGVYSGRCNIRNRIIEYPKNPKQIHVNLESGETAHFTRKQSKVDQPDIYVADRLIHPGGSYFEYKIGGVDTLVGVTSKSKKGKELDKFQLRTFEYNNRRLQKVFLKNGRYIEYWFKNALVNSKKYKAILEEVCRPYGPTIKYEYSWNERISKKKWPDGRYVGISYCSGLKSDGKKAVRVKSLTAPVGKDASAVPIYTFEYEQIGTQKKDRPVGGKTIVTDALGRKKIYVYSQEHRLNSISELDAKNHPYRKETFEWGGENSIDYTFLLARHIRDGDGSILMCRSWKYDQKGNMIEEKLSGNLSGASDVRPVYRRQGVFEENGCEHYIKKFAYDSSNRLVSETDSDLKINYTYWPNTDRVKQKTTIENGNTIERAYYAYDDNGFLVTEIVDDGTSADMEDLTSVTERHIRRITPTSSEPFNLPEEESEYYYDWETGAEKLLKKVVNHYNSDSFLTQQDVYDSDSTYRYSCFRECDRQGKITYEKDAEGNETFRGFDANGNVIEERFAGIKAVYEYDLSNRLIESIEYHDDGSEYTKQFTYDLRGNKLSETDGLGNKTEYQYDDFDRLISVVSPAIETEDSAWIYPVESCEYDLLNNKVKGINALGGIVQAEYTIRGEPAKKIYPDGGVEAFVYALNGSLTEFHDTQGNITRCSYDSRKRKTREEKFSQSGELLLERSWKYNAFHLLEEVDAEGRKTRFFYDPAGRLIREQTGAAETRYFYDSLGRRVEQWDKLDEFSYRKLITEMDYLDRKIGERVESDEGELLQQKSCSYDAYGNQVMASLATDQGPSTSYTCYNSKKQPIVVIAPNGSRTEYHYYRMTNSIGQTVECVEEVSPLGLVKRQIMGTSGKPSFQSLIAPDGTVLHRSFYYYDGLGNQVLRREDIYEKGDFIRTTFTAFEYDSMQRTTRIIEALGSDCEKCTQKQYNSSGQLIKEVKPDGIALLYEYDSLGFLCRLLSTDDSICYRYRYDRNGNLLSSSDLHHNVPISRKWDEQGHLLEEQFGDDHTLTYTYDALGRLNTLSLPDSSQIAYEYNALHLASVTRKTGRGSYQTKYSYDLSGRVKNVVLPFGLGDIGYCYDDSLRFSKSHSPYWSLEIPSNGYDAEGNITFVRVEDAEGGYSACYEYDALHQLVYESGAFSHSYQFDSANNRTRKDETIYLSNSLNQLVQEGEETYSYDRNGNFEAATHREETCHYDALGRLILVEKAEEKFEYQYDSEHRRRKKIHHRLIEGEWRQNSCEEYLYQGSNEIAVLGAAGGIAQLRVLGVGNGQDVGSACAIEVSGSCYIPFHDWRGNIVTLVDSRDGKIAETIRYSAYGEEKIYQNSITPWRFSSKRLDPETGWLYFGRRFYDPQIGRWTTPDPLMFEDGINLYAYVKNRPLLYIDPDGTKASLYGVLSAIFYGKPKSFERYYEYEDEMNARLKNKNYSNRATVIGEQTPGKMLCFMNGIMNSHEDAQKNVQKLSEYAGGKSVSLVYNASYGITRDPGEAAQNIAGVCTTPVRELHTEWDDFFEQNGEDAKILLILHSQACVHGRNALSTYDEARRKNITVLAVAPCAYISSEICGKSTHLVSYFDLVPWVDFFNRFNPEYNIEFMWPHEDAFKWFDHEFASPTYQESIEFYINDFYKSHS